MHDKETHMQSSTQHTTVQENLPHRVFTQVTKSLKSMKTQNTQVCLHSDARSTQHFDAAAPGPTSNLHHALWQVHLCYNQTPSLLQIKSSGQIAEELHTSCRCRATLEGRVLLYLACSYASVNSSPSAKCIDPRQSFLWITTCGKGSSDHHFYQTLVATQLRSSMQ